MLHLGALAIHKYVELIRQFQSCPLEHGQRVFQQAILHQMLSYLQDDFLRVNGTGATITRQDTLVFEDAIHAIRTAAGDGFRVVAVRDESMREYETEIRAIAEQYLDIITDCEVNI